MPALPANFATLPPTRQKAETAQRNKKLKEQKQQIKTFLQQRPNINKVGGYA